MLTNRALDSHSARHNDHEFEKVLNLFSSRNVFILMEIKKSVDQFDVWKLRKKVLQVENFLQSKNVKT